MPALDCPPLEQLSDYVIGRLPNGTLDAIAIHLEMCRDCDTSVQAIEGRAGALLGCVANAPPDSPWIHERQLKHVMESAEILGRELSSDTDFPGRSTPSQQSLPARLGPYELLEMAGQGGMGIVYKARHTLLDRIDAVKVLPAERMQDSEAVRRFMREMKVVGQLDHPNLVQARYADQFDKVWVLVMDWVDGETLSQRAQRLGRLGPAEACSLIIQAARGLQHAHDKGVVHRDVKPGNLMLTGQGQLKVLDLGLARLCGEFGMIGDSTGSGMILGTADYIAPEQVGGARLADHRADIYALGCTLYSLLAGRPPFLRNSTLEKLLAHQKEQPENLESLAPGLPRGLAGVVERMMAKGPEHRFQHMREVITALEPFAHGTVAGPKSESTAQIRAEVLAELAKEEAAPRALPIRNRGRRKWLVVAAILAFLGMAVMGVVSLKWKTPQGVVEVRLMEPDVEVFIDGGKMTLDSPQLGHIELSTEKDHIIVVKRGEEKLKTETFSVEKSGKTILEVRWPPRVVVEKTGLDRLDPTNIPEAKRYPWLPKETVAVFGQLTPEGKPTGAMSRVAFSPDGTRLATSGEQPNHPIVLWEVLTGRELRRWKLRDGLGASFVAYSPDGKGVLAGGWHDHSRIWSVDSDAELYRVNARAQDLSEVIFHAAFMPNNRIVTVHRDNHDGPCTLRIWNVGTNDPPKEFKGHKHYVSEVAVSPDGRFLLSGGRGRDPSLRLWNVASGKEVWSFVEKGNDPTILAVVFAPRPNGDLTKKDLAASAGTSTVPTRLWDVNATGEMKERFTLEGIGQGVSTMCLAFTPDGKQLAAGTDDGRLLFWDCATGKKVREIVASGKISGLSFAPDGRHLATANHNGIACILRLSAP
jgi:WD40 repeat protein